MLANKLYGPGNIWFGTGLLLLGCYFVFHSVSVHASFGPDTVRKTNTGIFSQWHIMI